MIEISYDGVSSGSAITIEAIHVYFGRDIGNLAFVMQRYKFSNWK